MSERNGDRARFGRERQRKILRRQRIRELRKALDPGLSTQIQNNKETEREAMREPDAR